MGSEVVVVKRNRRRAFALLWAAPAWLRSIAVGARTLLDSKETAASETAAGSRSAFAADADLVEAAPLAVPALSWNAEGQHACTGCQRCAEVCPSLCLEIEGTSESAGGQGVERFFLELGRCIGCGDCVAVCPESALLASPLGVGGYAMASGDPGLRKDLLASEGAAS